MTVNISATFKRAEKPLNGLEAIAEKLVDEKLLHAEYVIVATVRPKRIGIDAEDGTRTPAVRLDHIEVMEGERADEARALLAEAYEERTGKGPQLPLDFGVPGADGEREVPEADADEILAERAERQAAEQGDDGAGR